MTGGRRVAEKNVQIVGPPPSQPFCYSAKGRVRGLELGGPRVEVAIQIDGNLDFGGGVA